MIWSLILPIAGVLAGAVASWRGAMVRSWWHAMAAQSASRASTPSICVVIPARDEEESLPGLLRSLKAQSSASGKPLDPRILVVDDGSRDNSAGIAHDSGAKVIALSSEHAAAGNPKAKALAKAESLIEGEVVVFIDADVVLSSPDALATLAEAVRSAPGDLFSVQPFHRCNGFVESLAILPNVVALMASGALAAGNAAFGSKVAFGPVIAMDAARYRAVGGHGAVADSVVEDAALAERVRAAGGVAHVLPGADRVWFRMYPQGLRQQFEGFTKNLALGARAAASWPALLAFLWILGLYSSLAASLHPMPSASAALVAWAPLLAYVAELVALSRVAGRYSWWIYPLVSVAAVFFLAVSVTSLFRTVVLRQVRWKGRSIRIGGGR